MVLPPEFEFQILADQYCSRIKDSFLVPCVKSQFLGKTCILGFHASSLLDFNVVTSQVVVFLALERIRPFVSVHEKKRGASQNDESADFLEKNSW